MSENKNEELEQILQEVTEQEVTFIEQPKGEETPTMDNSVVFKLLYSQVFNLIASRRGEHWRLSDTEVEQLSIATGAVMEKYAPSLDIGVEGTLIVTAAMVALPRLAIEFKPTEPKGESDGEK